MTPITRERIIRSALKAVIAGEGAIDERFEIVCGLLEKIKPSDRRLIVKNLKARLTRALRQKKATLRSAMALSAETKNRLEQIAASRGMIFSEEILSPELLAGFSLQLGDNRTDYSLKGRLEQFV